MNLCGKNVVYIGGFGGIGFATCQILATKQLKHLIVLDLTLQSDHLRALQAIHSNTHFKAFDISSDLSVVRQTIADICHEFKTIDVMVNGAGIAIETAEMISRIMKVNLEGPINVMVALMEKFDKRNGAPGGLTIVNISSIAGLQPVEAFPTYSATKAGINAFSAALAKIYEKTGVTVITICPAATNTAMLGSVESFINDDREFIEAVKKMSMQSADECAANIVAAIERHDNGSVWVLESGTIELAQ